MINFENYFEDFYNEEEVDVDDIIEFIPPVDLDEDLDDLDEDLDVIDELNFD